MYRTNRWEQLRQCQTCSIHLRWSNLFFLKDLSLIHWSIKKVELLFLPPSSGESSRTWISWQWPNQSRHRNNENHEFQIITLIKKNKSEQWQSNKYIFIYTLFIDNKEDILVWIFKAFSKARHHLCCPQSAFWQASQEGATH